MNRNVPILIAGGAAALLLGGFGLIADTVVEGETQSVDMAILMALRTPGQTAIPIGPSWLPEMARDVTALGSVSVLGLLVVFVAVLMLVVHRARTAWFLVGSVIGGTVVSMVLKDAFNRPRPDIAGVPRVFTASFPSGHSTLSAVVYLTLGLLLALHVSARGQKVYYVTVAVVLTVLVGISRVYLGVHYPTDVLAGWSLGSAWAILSAMVAYKMGLNRPTASNPV